MINIKTIEDFQSLNPEIQAGIFKHLTVLFLVEGATDEGVGEKIFQDEAFGTYMKGVGEIMHQTLDIDDAVLPELMRLLVKRHILAPNT